MASLGIPEFLKADVRVAKTGPGEELLQISKEELQARLKNAADEGFENGVSRGRELQREEEASAFSDLRDSLEKQRRRAGDAAKRFQNALIDVTEEIDHIDERVAEVLEAACCAIATRLLCRANISEEIIAALVSGIASEFNPTGIVATVDPELVDELTEAFAENERIEVVAGRDGAPLSIGFRTRAGSFEYQLQQAYEQLQTAIGQKINAKS